MNAADVLADSWKEYSRPPRPALTLPAFMVRGLLAHGEQGEHRGGIYIDPDAEMWRPKLIGQDIAGHSIVVLLPLSAEAGDTDAD